MLPDEKFKGFEAFLDIENEKNISVPNSLLNKTNTFINRFFYDLFCLIDVVHCVRDLKHILRNPLVIRQDNVQVNRRQRTFIPKRMVNNVTTSIGEEL